MKAYQKLFLPREQRMRIGQRPDTRTPAAIGEASAEAVFSPEVGDALNRARASLAAVGILVEAEMEELLKRTVEGLVSIKRYLDEEYGELQIIGRGECRNGPMPGQALPDFVALSSRQNLPVLVEVKNSARVSPAEDRFQAAYYNTLARQVGVVVLEQRIESGYLTLAPKAFHETVAETILVYPRLEAYEKISNTIDLNMDTVEELWRAKQLGYVGKTPYRDCDPACPHFRLARRLRVELPEGNLETATPLPLIHARGEVEQGADLDTTYLRSYLQRTGITRTLFLTAYALTGRPDVEAMRQATELVAGKTGISLESVERVLRAENKADPEAVERIMANEIEPWRRIIGRERLKKEAGSIKGIATRLYPLPQGSEGFVKGSWRQWEG